LQKLLEGTEGTRKFTGEREEVFRGVPTRSDIQTGIKRVVHVIIIIEATSHICFNMEVTVEMGKGNILVF
jgi:hypothetical protein